MTSHTNIFKPPFILAIYALCFLYSVASGTFAFKCCRVVKEEEKLRHQRGGLPRGNNQRLFGQSQREMAATKNPFGLRVNRINLRSSATSISSFPRNQQTQFRVKLLLPVSRFRIAPTLSALLYHLCKTILIPSDLVATVYCPTHQL